MQAIIKYVRRELAPYKMIIFVYVFLFAIIIALLTAVKAPALNYLMKEGWEKGNRDIVLYVPFLIALSFIAANIFRYFHMYKMKFTADQITVNIRRQLLNKYLNLNLSFFQENERGSGGLISKMINDINEIQNGMQKVADLIREPMIAIISFGYLLYLDWQLTLMLITSIPIISAILRNLAKSVYRYAHLSFEAMEDLAKTLKETLDGIRVIQSFNLQEEMNKRFEKQSENYLHTRQKIISREEVSSPISEIITSFTFALFLVYAGMQFLDGKMTMAIFLSYLTGVFMLQDAIRKTQISYVRLQSTTSALERIYSIMDKTSVVDNPPAPAAFPNAWKTIEYKNVSFSFGERKILKNINLKINRGEIVALVGASGGGKSTMINLLERFFDPEEGQVLIDQVPINKMALEDLRRNIALVTQDVFLFGDTIERNIHSGDFSKSKENIQQAAKAAFAHEFISKTEKGYKSNAGDLGGLLSGGEKQRLSIARAILKDSPILLLDEATSALDSQSEKDVQKGLDKLLENRTALVIAHRLSTITKADRILVMMNGEIVEEGTHQALLEKQGEYFKLHQLQQS